MSEQPGPTCTDSCKSKPSGMAWQVVICSVAAIGVVVSCTLLCLHLLTLDTAAKAEFGTFGDAFGAVNATFSGLALVGLIATILFQQRELRYTREEMEKARKVAEKSQEAHEELVDQQIATRNAILLQSQVTSESSLIDVRMKTLELQASTLIHQGRDVRSYRYNDVSFGVLLDETLKMANDLVETAKKQADASTEIAGENTD